MLYENHKELVIDHVIFAAIEKKISKTEFLKLYKEIKKFKKKGFPINGTDLKKVGFVFVRPLRGGLTTDFDKNFSKDKKFKAKFGEGQIRALFKKI